MRFRHNLFLGIVWPLSVLIDLIVTGESLGARFNILRLFFSRRSPFFLVIPIILGKMLLEGMPHQQALEYFAASCIIGIIAELEAVDGVLSIATLFHGLSARMLLLGLTVSLALHL